MSVTSIDANTLAKMFVAGAKSLEAKKEWINELNVFPVPDGDTGTNMTLTIMSAADEVSSLYSTGDINMETLCKAISSGSLRGARGNSGVILSQLFRGFTKVVKKLENDITPADFAEGCSKACETAYKAVMKPKEGTILTVSKAVADKVCEVVDSGETDFNVIFEKALAYGDEILLKTPEMLPVLKQAGVVDSGGQGLMEVLKGGYAAFCGKEVDFTTEKKEAPVKENVAKDVAPAQIKFGYCTEFIILLNKTFNVKSELDFKEYLESIGDSIVLVTDEDVVKVHVHTNDPGLAIQRALKYGQLDRLKIDNMRLENLEKISKRHENVTLETEVPVEEPKADEPRKDIGFIAVSVGEGLGEIFTSLGVDALIEGGQTMNPSTEDMLNAIDKVNADNIFILPNNKNIIMAAQQAASITEDKNIIVIPTKTVPQGITAMINYVPDLSADENNTVMTEQIANVLTGQVTYAVRDTMIDDKEIKQGDFMGIGDAGILSVGKDKTEVTVCMIEEMVNDDSEIISIYYGDDIDDDTAQNVADIVAEKFGDCDVEVQKGGQPIYSYIVSVE